MTPGHTHRLPGSPIDFSFAAARPQFSLFPSSLFSSQSSFTQKLIFHTQAFGSFRRAFLFPIYSRMFQIHRVCASRCRRLNEPHWSSGFECLQKPARAPSSRWGARPANRCVWVNLMIPTRCRREIKEGGRHPRGARFTPAVGRAPEASAADLKSRRFRQLPLRPALFFLDAAPQWFSRAPLRVF